MNIIELLIEETHNLDQYNDSIEKIINHAEKVKIPNKNIDTLDSYRDKKLEKIFDNKIKVYITYNYDTNYNSLRAYTGTGELLSDEKVSVLNINLYYFKEKDKLNKEELRKTIRHELTHLLDSGKISKIKNKIDLKTGGSCKVYKKKGYSAYKKTGMEMNAFIHFVKDYKNKVGEPYNIMFPNLDTFYNIIIRKEQFFDTIKTFYKYRTEEDDFIVPKQILDYFNDKEFKKMALRRLYRENLLPKNLMKGGKI